MLNDVRRGRLLCQIIGCSVVLSPAGRACDVRKSIFNLTLPAPTSSVFRATPHVLLPVAMSGVYWDDDWNSAISRKRMERLTRGFSEARRARKRFIAAVSCAPNRAAELIATRSHYPGVWTPSCNQFKASLVFFASTH